MLAIELIVILGILFIIFVSRKSGNVRDVADSTSPETLSQRTSDTQPVGRIFTLAELRQAEEGKYFWDETGSVFVIEPDGSVTTVGSFDPSELLIDTKMEMLEKMKISGFFDMLPRMWSYSYSEFSNRTYGDKFVFVYEHNYVFMTDYAPTIDGVRNASIRTDSNVSHFPIVDLLCDTASGQMLLLPLNVREYILSLGAQACIRRIFNGKVRVRISMPTTMGALWLGVEPDTLSKERRVSFAFGNADEYRCCDMTVGDGICEVDNVFKESVIQPQIMPVALNCIAKGCLVQSLCLFGMICDMVVLDMLPLPMCLMLRKGDGVIEPLLVVNKNIVPFVKRKERVFVDGSNKISFFIDDIEIIDDVLSECNSTCPVADICIETDGDGAICVSIVEGNHAHRINVGELIG